MLTYLARKVFGTRNDRVIKSLNEIVKRVNDLESTFSEKSETELREMTTRFRERLNQGETLDDIEPEAYAVVREAAKRVLGMRHFDVQIIGGAVLHRGMIAEMKTGEGKTLVSTLPAYLNALTGNGVHIVTVNDYLAQRDAAWMGKVHTFLGLSVGVIYPHMDEGKKVDAYNCDITYGQNNEFGFDYLRDNMKFFEEDVFQKTHSFAIIDEVDSILIDEARTPLIISGPAEKPTELYKKINKIIPHLKEEAHFEIDLRSKNPLLTEEGVKYAEQLLEIDNLYDPRHIENLHHVNQALKAHTTLQRDTDYVVNDGEIVIVDEFTGRLMPGRRWSNGLHQAIEAKEGLEIARENQTLASITFQNFFRMYEKLSGMTGTADTEAVEFKEIYSLEVVVIPTNKPLLRDDQSDLIYRTKQEKYNAVVNDIIEITQTGQPILVGTVSIEQSEYISQLLKKKNVTHSVLNAKQHEREADIVAQAGRLHSVTIATNMAGRGTDIMLGGNPEALAEAHQSSSDNGDEASMPDAQLEKFKKQCTQEKEIVLAKGGLCILGTERHESRRIDNQLRGRAGRQGDPGLSRFYISLEDELMHRFGGERIKAIMERIGWEEGTAIDGNLISKQIERAQKRVEGMHFESRKHVTEYDDVMNKQRKIIYQRRREVLSAETYHEEVRAMITDIIEISVEELLEERTSITDKDFETLSQRVKHVFNAEVDKSIFPELKKQVFTENLTKAMCALYDARCEQKNAKLIALHEYTQKQQEDPELPTGIPTYSQLEKRTALEVIDHFWNQHIADMEELREGIGLRGYGQLNPLYEYQREGFQLFQHLILTIKENTVRRLFYEDVVDVETLITNLEQEEQRRRELEEQLSLSHNESEGAGEVPEQIQLTPDQARAKLDEQRKARRKRK